MNFQDAAKIWAIRRFKRHLHVTPDQIENVTFDLKIVEEGTCDTCSYEDVGIEVCVRLGNGNMYFDEIPRFGFQELLEDLLTIANEEGE